MKKTDKFVFFNVIYILFIYTLFSVTFLIVYHDNIKAIENNMIIVQIDSMQEPISYTSLESAVNSIESNGLITMFKNSINENIVVNENQKIILDLNGYDIFREKGSAIINYGELTIMSSNGKIMNDDNLSAVINNLGKLIIDEDVDAEQIHIIGKGAGIQNQSIVTLLGGMIVSEYSYAISGGDINYLGGVLKAKASSVEYTYNSGVVDDYGEYTIIESGYYKTVCKKNLFSIGDSSYNSLNQAIVEADDKDLIVLNTNVTELAIIPLDKSVTIDLNGYVLNNYVNDSQFNTAQNKNYNFITVREDASLVIKNGTIETYGTTVPVKNKGQLVIEGLTIKSDSQTVINDYGAKLYFNSGILKSYNQDIYSSANRDMFIIEGNHIDLTTEDDLYVATIANGNLLDLNMQINAEILDSNLVINIEQNQFNINEGSLNIYLKSNTTADYNSYEEKLDCDIQVGKCMIGLTVNNSNNILVNRLAYLYHLIYENELVIKYSNETHVEIIKRNLRIINNETIPNISLENGKNRLIVDHETITIIMNSSMKSIDINDFIDIKNILFGRENIRMLVSNVELNDINIDDFNSDECLDDEGKLVCEREFAYIKKISMIENVPVPLIENSTIKVILNKNVPKLADSTINGKQTTCEYNQSCAIEMINFKSSIGEDVTTVETSIEFNGQYLSKIDASVLGEYVVTSVGIDKNGNRSDEVVRIYNVVDTVKPVIELNETVTVKIGHTYKDFDVKAYDNYDKEIAVERITNNVKFDKAGTYKVGYRAVDSSGNETIVYRTLIVENDNSGLWVGIICGFITLMTIGIYIGYILLKKKKSTV